MSCDAKAADPTSGGGLVVQGLVQGLYVAYARALGRNSVNTRLRKVLSWEPTVSLEDGRGRTYGWIEGQVQQRLNGVGGTPAARG